MFHEKGSFRKKMPVAIFKYITLKLSLCKQNTSYLRRLMLITIVTGLI